MNHPDRCAVFKLLFIQRLTNVGGAARVCILDCRTKLLKSVLSIGGFAHMTTAYLYPPIYL